jgi:hypothetical protein
VLTEKVEAGRDARPLLGVLGAFDRLCGRIRERHTEEVRGDFAVLARLLPGIGRLMWMQVATASEKWCKDHLSFHNVRFCK